MKARLVEYQAGTSAYLSADNFPWQVGAVLMVAATILWGVVLIGNVDANSTSIGLWLVSLIFSVWYLYANHNRQIYLMMLRTLAEIESEFGMEFNRRFWKTEDLKNPELNLAPTRYEYVLRFPRGHQLNCAFYILGSLGGPVAACVLGTGPGSALVVAVIITIATITIAHVSNHFATVRLRKEKDTTSPTSG